LVRRVSRNTNSSEPNLVRADLLNLAEAKKAVNGSAYVYLCIGLPYSTKIWKTHWTQIMNNVITACEQHNANLIFLDNVYMYSSPLPIPFDENAPQSPSTHKGLVRKETADLMMHAMEDGSIKGLIGRSADFYGVGAVNSPFYISFLERMLQGKNPQTLSPTNIKHTYANVEDNGRALVELALSDDCYGQVWHLPVGEPITTSEMLVHFNKAMEGDFKLSPMPKILRKILALFIPQLKEVDEMLYQIENEYIMNYDKFQSRFPEFNVTTYEQGVKDMIQSFKPATEPAANKTYDGNVAPSHM